MFPEYNLEWLNYVVDCRRGGLLQQNYDFVEGGIANDNVIILLKILKVVELQQSKH